jgi:hypothetical protein
LTTGPRVENYPDLDGMVAEGTLVHKSGWYEAFDKVSRDAIIQYATAIKINKQGKAQFKIAKASKKLKALAAKL